MMKDTGIGFVRVVWPTSLPEDGYDKRPMDIP
jgi:hypothetical protein